MLGDIEGVFSEIVVICVMALEAIGATIIMVAAARALFAIFRNPHRSRELLFEGIASGLGFLLGSEVLKTLIAPDWKDIAMTGAILVMRAGVTLLVHWENKVEMTKKTNMDIKKGEAE